MPEQVLLCWVLLLLQGPELWCRREPSNIVQPAVMVCKL
jgi:hypothetical protein